MTVSILIKSKRTTVTLSAVEVNQKDYILMYLLNNKTRAMAKLGKL
ncbi:hypothetical protein SCB49_01442 [unidentified eubacterium SCB49]|nr:hypothetical protein SCB49_01442 [unidentified eubacterium SCB49]